MNQDLCVLIFHKHGKQIQEGMHGNVQYDGGVISRISGSNQVESLNVSVSDWLVFRVFDESRGNGKHFFACLFQNKTDRSKRGREK